MSKNTHNVTQFQNFEFEPLKKRHLTYLAKVEVGKTGAETMPSGEKELPQDEIEKKLNEGKEKGVKLTKEVDKDLLEIAKKVYKTKNTQEKYKLELRQAYVDNLQKYNLTPESFWEFLNKEKFERITIKDGKFTYIKNDLETSEVPPGGINAKGIAIDAPSGKVEKDEKKPAPKDKVKKPEAKEKSKEELSADQTTIEEFKKSFPNVDAAKIKVGANRMVEGTKATIRFSRYSSSIAAIYQEGGKRTELLDENTGAKKADVVIKSPSVVEAPNSDGVMTKYVYVDLTVNGSIMNGTKTGWMDIKRLSELKVPKQEEKVAIDVKEEKIADEKTKVEETEKVKEKRKPYLDDKGIVHLKTLQEIHDIKLQTLFPNAKKGDTVQVTSKISGAISTATFDGKDWLDLNKKHVPILNGDRVILTSQIDYEKEKPKAPALGPDYKLIETAPRQLTPEQIKDAKTGKLNWNKIAKDLIEEFPQIKESGWTTLDYAKLLKIYSTETGYYWVFEPPKVKPSAEKEAAAEIGTGKKEAAIRTKKAKKEAEEHSEKIYDNHKNRIWNNEQYYFNEKEKINEYVNDPAKWKEAWDKNYPINSKLILKAFRHEPFNNIPETKIRDGVREMIYTSGVITVNFFKPSDLFDKFNKQGEFYRTLDNEPGSYSDFKEEWKLISVVIPKKIQENEDRGKAQNYGFSTKEEKAFQAWLWGNEEKFHQTAVGMAGIFDAIQNIIKPESEKQKVIKVVPEQGESKMSLLDTTLAAYYRGIIYDNNDLTTPDAIDEYINDQKKWDNMWDHDKGNIGLLKQALQRPPFNKTSLGAHKTKIREAMHDSLSKNDINMGDLLSYLNEDGKIYKNRKGKPGRFSDFEDEFYTEQLGNKVRKGVALTEKEQKYYDKQPDKEKLGDRYDELTQLWVSAAYIFDAISKLDPNGTFEAAPGPSFSVDDASPYVNQIFPQSDTGSINGVSQDYYDTYKEGGERIAGGGVFTGGLFRYDFREDAKGISDMDRITSNATANKIILDQCGMNEGKVDRKRLQARLNELIMLGISSLITQPESTERTKALEALGITKEDLEKPDVVVIAAKKHEINFEKSNKLTPAQKDLIRLGFLLETVAKPGLVKEGTEVVEWSVDPKIRRLQKEALRLGAKPQDLKKIEEEMNIQIAAFLDMKVGKNFSSIDSVGVTFPLTIAGKGKNVIVLAVNQSYSPTDKKFVFRAGIGGSVEIAKNLSLMGGIGITSEGKAFAGAGVSFDVPIKDTAWDANMTIGAMASTDFKGYDVVVGGALMFKRNLAKQFKEDLDKNLEKNGYAEVEKAGSTHEKAELLRNLPGVNGRVIAQIDATLGLNDEQLVNLYEQHLRKRIEIGTAEAGLSEHKFLGFLPPITAAGIGLGFRLRPDQPPTIMPGFAFAISIGGELVIFQRPVTSTEAMIAGGEEKMEKQAEEKILSQKQFIAKAKEAGYSTVKFESAALVGDIASGMKPIKRENYKVESKPAENPDEAEIEKSFQEFKKELAQKGMQLEKVGNMYRLRILNVGNYEVYVDPQMKEKTGVFLRDGDIFISANKNPKLVLKRMDMYYPRPKEGNIKHTIVTISDADFRTQRSIMDESDYFLDSRTTDATGTERTALTRMSIGDKTPTQENLIEWEKDKKYNKYETLDTTTAEMLKYREQAEKERANGEMGQKVVEKIGTADMKAIDIAKVHGMAETFMKNHPTDYRKYTTYQFKTDADFKKLNAIIKKDFPDATKDEVIALKEELFNLSMTEAEAGMEKLNPEKKLEKKKELILQRLEWMKNSIYVPFFKKNITKENNPQDFTPEQVAEAYIAPLRAMTLKDPESVPLGARIDVAVGSENIVGQRGVIVGNPETIKNHRIFVAKDYSQALLTGKPEIDRTIALVFRESQRPFEKLDDTQFLKSPLALKLMTLGTDKNNPVLIKLLGVENYQQLSKCYDTKPPMIIEGAADAVKQLRDLAKKLSDAQTGTGGTTILIDDKEYQSLIINGTIIGIRTQSFKSGVYERCLNASNMYSDEIVALSSTEKSVLVGNFRSYNAAGAQSLSSSEAVHHINLGVGVAFEFGTEPQQPVPGKTNETPNEPAPGNEGSTAGKMPTTEIPKQPIVTVPTNPQGGGATPEDI